MVYWVSQNIEKTKSEKHIADMINDGWKILGQDELVQLFESKQQIITSPEIKGVSEFSVVVDADNNYYLQNSRQKKSAYSPFMPNPLLRRFFKIKGQYIAGQKPISQNISGQKMSTNIEKLNEYIMYPDLDASIKIEEIDQKRDKTDYDLGYRFKAKIGYPESLGEQGNYDEGYAYKTYPTEEEQKTDIRELLESERKTIIEGGKKAWGLEEIYSGRDENILKAINKVLAKKEIGQKPTKKEYEIKYISKDRLHLKGKMRGSIKTWICAENREDAIVIIKEEEDFGELVYVKPTGNTGNLSACAVEKEWLEAVEKEWLEEDGDAQEEKTFHDEFKPNLWHLTLKEFVDYAKDYDDERLKGVADYEDFYRNTIVKPLLHESQERNVFLLAVETGQLTYEKATEIIKSVKFWDSNNKFIGELIDYDRHRNYEANILKTPKELYLSEPYFKSHFTTKSASNWYDKEIEQALNNGVFLRYMKNGIIKYKDIEARLKESGNFNEKNKNLIIIQRYSKLIPITNKLKTLYNNLVTIYEDGGEINSCGCVHSLSKGGIIAYHGSPYDFNSFNSSMIGRGEGASGWGYGFYFSENINDAKDYVRKLEKEKKEGRLYKVRIPNNDYFLKIDERVENQSKYVFNAIMNMPKEYKIKLFSDEYEKNKQIIENDIENKEYDFEIGSNDYWELVDYVLDYNLKKTGNNFYDLIKEKIAGGYEYESSEFLHKIGIKGNKHNAFGYTNYIVFNYNDIEIIKKTIPRLYKGGSVGIDLKNKLKTLSELLKYPKTLSVIRDLDKISPKENVPNDILPKNERAYVNKLIADNKDGVRYNKPLLEKTAREYGIMDQNMAKELAELSIVLMAREISLEK